MEDKEAIPWSNVAKLSTTPHQIYGLQILPPIPTLPSHSVECFLYCEKVLIFAFIVHAFGVISKKLLTNPIS